MHSFPELCLHHTGIVTKSLCRDSELYGALGYEVLGEIITDCVQSNRLLFMRNRASGELIELIEPASEGSTVSKLPPGYAHICYETPDLDEFAAAFKKRKLGVIFTDKIEAPAFGGRRILFAMLKNNTVIEVLESGNKEE